MDWKSPFWLKNASFCIRCTKQRWKISEKISLMTIKNWRKKLDFALFLWYNYSAWYALKREVATKVGNFRGVCPLNGRKNSQNTKEFCFFRSLLVPTQTTKSVFVREVAKHPIQCSRKMPQQNSFDDANRYIYYIYARKPLYIVVRWLADKRTKS